MEEKTLIGEQTQNESFVFFKSMFEAVEYIPKAETSFNKMICNSFKQIAELFDKTESWARVTYHRARLKIKEELK